MPETNTIPLPVTAPGTLINRTWQQKHATPQWFGWLANHILSQIPLRRSTTRNRPLRDTTALNACIWQLADEAANRTSLFNRVGADLPDWLLGQFLQPAVMDTLQRHAHPDIPHILLQAINLRKRQAMGEIIPSQEWNDLRGTITEELLVLEPDRKLNLPELTAVTYRADLHCLQYTLRATLCAIEKNTPSAIAQCVAHAVQAYEANSQKLSDTAYLMVAEHLLHLMNGNNLPFTVHEL